MNPRPVVFLDRDGTIIFERNYLSDPKQVALLPGAVAGLRKLQSLGFRLVIITNQSGVARGYFDEDCVARVHQRLSQLLGAHGVNIDAVYYCPHHPADKCDCRKPRPGLLLRAAADFHFDPSQAYMIGDKVCDIEVGQAVGATTVLVRTGYGAEEERAGPIGAHCVASYLDDAAKFIARHYAEERDVGHECIAV